MNPTSIKVDLTPNTSWRKNTLQEGKIDIMDINDNSFITTIPDFPKDGFNFPDITPLIEENQPLFKSIIDSMVIHWQGYNIDKVVCIESFGYVFGIPLALALDKQFVLARKSGKLPREVVSQKYDMCYDSGKTLEMHKSSVKHGDEVIVVDDFLASGGTFDATIQLAEKLGANVIGGSFVVELPELGARERNQIKKNHVYAFSQMRYDLILRKWVILEPGDSL